MTSALQVRANSASSARDALIVHFPWPDTFATATRMARSWISVECVVRGIDGLLFTLNYVWVSSAMGYSTQRAVLLLFQGPDPIELTKAG